MEDNSLSVEDLLVQRNPEAMLDVLTIQSLRSRYVDCDVTSVASEPLLALDRDIDTFVRDFQIDDSISDIFALGADEGEEIRSASNQVLEASVLLPHNSNAKAVKKSSRRSKSVENILEITELGSTSSKKQKTFGNFFSRKSKSKVESRKGKAVSWNPDGSDVTHRFTSRQYGRQSRDDIDEVGGGYMTMNRLGAGPTIIKGGKLEENRRSAQQKQLSLDIEGEYAILHPAKSDNSCLAKLLGFLDSDNTDSLIHELSNLEPPAASGLTDDKGDNLLHKCVERKKSSSIAIITSIHPHLARQRNNDGLTPLELAVKLGRTECLQILLGKCLSHTGDAALSEVSSLLSFSLLQNQHKITEIILDHLSTFKPVDLDVLTAIGDTRAPPGHVAASRDDLVCLQRLVEMGFDVTSAGCQGTLPIDVAHNNGNQASFRYLMLVHLLETVLQEVSTSRVCQGCSQTKKDVDTIQSKVGVLQLASLQYQSLVDRQQVSTRRGIQIVDELLQGKDNIDGTDKLVQLKNLLLGMSSESFTSVSRPVSQLQAFTSTIGGASQWRDGRRSVDVKRKTRRLVKSVHESGDKSNEAVARLVRRVLVSPLPASPAAQRTSNTDTQRTSTTDAQPISNTSRKCRETTTSPSIVGNKAMSDDHDHSYVTGDVESEKLIVVDLPPPHEAQDNDYSSLPRHLRVPPLSSHDYVSIDKVTTESHIKWNDEATNTDSGSESSEVTQCKDSYDMKSTHREESTAVKHSPTSQSADTYQVHPTHKMSPEYAMLSSGISDTTERRDLNSDCSDDDMSTISSHNSTLQSAVGRLSPGYLSDTAEHCRSDLHSGRLVVSNESNGLIGQFDVSDFTDTSSDWWSSSRCTSCFTHNTTSHVTSYESEDDYEDHTVRLNLEHEDLPDDLLRNHRLCRHLEAVRRMNTENTDVIETVVTATGERMVSDISTEESRYVNISEASDGSNEMSMSDSMKGKSKSRVKLFNHHDLVCKRELSKSEFSECYDRSADVQQKRRCHDDLDLPWDQLQFSDVEDDATSERPWYDVSEDEDSLVHAMSSDSDTSTLC